VVDLLSCVRPTIALTSATRTRTTAHAHALPHTHTHTRRRTVLFDPGDGCGNGGGARRNECRHDGAGAEGHVGPAPPRRGALAIANDPLRYRIGERFLFACRRSAPRGSRCLAVPKKV
jgi:hypothetical protein